MKDPLRLTKGPLERAFKNVRQPLPIMLSAMKTKIHMLLMGVLLSTIFFSISFAKETSVLSTDDAGGMSFPLVPPNQPTIVWDKTLGGFLADRLSSSIATPDGGYLLAGSSNSAASGDKSENSRGNTDYWIIKIDAQHNKQWDKTFGGDSYDEPLSVISTSDGGYLVTGWSMSDISGDKSEHNRGSTDYWVVKIDSQGNKLWDKTFGGSGSDLPYSIVSVPEGGYLLAGYSDSNTSGDKTQNSKGTLDFWIVRIDDLGNKIWDKTIGGSSDENLRSVTLTADGFLLGGTSISDISGDKSENSINSSSDYWVVKIDKQGNKVWDKTIGSGGADMLIWTLPTPDAGYLLTGHSDSGASGDKSEGNRGGFDYWVVKIDNQGNKKWDKTFGGDLDDNFPTAVSSPDGGYLLGGASFSNASGDKGESSRGSIDYWTVKIDSQGNKAWDKTIGGSNYDFPTSTILAADGTYGLAGYSFSNASGEKSENSKGNFDYWIVALKAPSIPAMISLTLINARTDQEIKELKDGDVINLKEVGSRLLDIRANIAAEKISKVVFDLKGPIKHHQTEKKSPYMLFGDHHGHFNGRKWLPGEYTLTVTPYIKDKKAPPLTISFTVTDGFSFSGFTLIDATLDQPISTLSEGDVIDLSLLKSTKLSVRADTEPMNVDKVVLNLQGPIVYFWIERYYPYTLFGDIPSQNGSTDYAGLKLVPGCYTLTATPYFDGVRGKPHAINFVVKDGEALEAGGLRVEVFPSPAVGVMNIIHRGKTDNAQMSLIDFNGNVLLRRPLNQQPVEQLDVSVFRKGIHYLKVVSPEGSQIIRVVIE